MSFKPTPLYGGALTLDLPTHFADTSLIRDIPSHQEVYLSTTGYTNIVIEILEYVDKPSDGEALQYHFADLVDETGDKTMILSQEAVQFADPELKSHPALSLTFTQTPTTPNQNRTKTPKFVHIFLILLRLKEKGADILVTVNVPCYEGEYDEGEDGGESEVVREGRGVRDRVLETLRVVEWGVFDG